MAMNRLSALLPELNSDRYEQVDKQITKMLAEGTMNEAIIANAARRTLKAVKLLEDYQKSEEWSKFGWGERLVKLDGKLYFIGELRYTEEDFDKAPFAAYEVIGIKKLKLKRRVNVYSGWQSDVTITWQGVKTMQLVKGRIFLEMPYSYVNEMLNK